MTRTIAYCTLLVLFAIVLCIAASNPDWLNDKNSFLFGFVNHEFLGLLGVIVSITLASIGQLHLSLNEIEKAAGKVFLVKTRANVKSSAYWLIALFLIGLALVVLKGSLSEASIETKVTAFALINGFAAVTVIWATLILISIMQVVFAIRPELPADEKDK